MNDLSTLKDHPRESQLYLKRALMASLLALALCLVLLGRLAYFQIFQHHRYTTLSQKNQLKMTPIPPTRGLIYDRNGKLLAGNAAAFSLEITANQTHNLQETLAALKELLNISPTQEQIFWKQLRYKRRTESIPLKLKLTEQDIATFSLKRHLFPGVDIVAHPVRHYPFKDLLAHVLGYIGPLNEQDMTQIDKMQYRGTYHIGKTGLEKFYENRLHGQIGYQQAETDAHGQIVRVQSTSAPTPGQNLALSIDLDLQQAAWQALAPLKGAIVALDPRNGEILAMISAPSFDPNLFTQGIDAETYDQWQFSPDRPLFNRVMHGLYPPASTVKSAVALQGLALKWITPKTVLFDPGYFQLQEEGRKYRDWNWKQGGHGYITLDKALAQSCDTYFFALANKIGLSALREVYQSFGLGQKTGVDFPGESPGLLPSHAWKQKVKKEPWYTGDTLNMGIGQGFLLSTPLQVAQMAAFLANRGHAFPPRFLMTQQNTEDQNETIPPPTPQSTLTFSEEHWAQVIDGMRKTVVHPQGTAHKIHPGLRYSIAAKTGTAQVFNLKADQKYDAHKLKAHLRDHSWFMGFAPIDRPQIAIAVLVENKYERSAAQVARQVLDQFFRSPSHANPSTEPSL